MAVLNPVKVIITNCISNDGLIDVVEIENNPEDENTSKRKVNFYNELYIERKDFNLNPDKKYNGLVLGGEVRLKGAYIIKAERYTVDETTGEIKEIYCTYDPLSKSGNEINRKIKGTIHWVSYKDALNIEVHNYENLFSVEEPNKYDDYINHINPNSLSINTNAFIENYFKECDTSYPFQFMRNGYYFIDKLSNGDKIIFNRTVTLKQTYK